MRFKTSLAMFVCFMLVTTLFSVQQSTDSFVRATPNPDSGFFEGYMPPRGAYLQVLASYPHISKDADEDGVYDLGVSWDSNSDGTPVAHYIQDPLTVDLQAHGFVPGDRMMIGFKQSMYSTTHSAFGYIMYGLFSSTDQLLNDPWTYDSPKDDIDWPMIGPLHRVPGAIDATLGGYAHRPADNTDTYYKQGQEVQTDIPEDFSLLGPVGQWNEGRNGVPWTLNTWWSSNCFWITVPPGAKYLFVSAVSQWMIGTDGTCSVTLDEDADGDGIPDSWERGPIDINKDGTDDLTLVGASDAQKDIFVEVDYMEGQEMDGGAKAAVEQAFEQCPTDVEYGPIALHIELDEQIPLHPDFNAWVAFDNYKSQYFGTEDTHNKANSYWYKAAKNYTHHYCIFIYGWSELNKTSNKWEPTTAGGCGELYGNDFWVSLGTWHHDAGGTPDEQAATFMHELGHNLGLNHGGSDKINYKPNYLSVMNYLFEYKGDPVRDRPLTYSSSKLASLDEQDLDEGAGIGSAPWPMTAYGAPVKGQTGVKYYPLPVSTSGGIDWNNNGVENEAGVKANINNFPIPGYDYFSPDNETLEGYEDWTNLKYDFHQSSRNFANGAHSIESEHVDLTWEIVQNLTAYEENGTPAPGEPLPLSSIVGTIAIVAAVAVIFGVVYYRRKKSD